MLQTLGWQIRDTNELIISRVRLSIARALRAAAAAADAADAQEDAVKHIIFHHKRKKICTNGRVAHSLAFELTVATFEASAERTAPRYAGRSEISAGCVRKRLRTFATHFVLMMCPRARTYGGAQFIRTGQQRPGVEKKKADLF